MLPNKHIGNSPKKSCFCSGFSIHIKVGFLALEYEILAPTRPGSPPQSPRATYYWQTDRIGHEYGETVGDDEKDMIMRGFYLRNRGFSALEIALNRLHYI